MVAELLHGMEYTLLATRKTPEGGGPPGCDAQFHHINGRIREFQARRQPVISVDTNKKESPGGGANGESGPEKVPDRGRAEGFAGAERGCAATAAYDVTRGAEWVRVAPTAIHQLWPRRASEDGGSPWEARRIPVPANC